MAVQAHGFTWENEITRNVFQLSTAPPYTSTFDVPASQNPLNSLENISIKVACGDKAECADVCRIFNYGDTSVTMIHLQWHQQDAETKQLTRVREFSLGGAATHRALFGDVTYEDIQGLVQMLRVIPAGPIDAAAKAAVHAEKTRLNAKSGAIRFNPKMDSKNQRRLQCSIPHLSEFLAANPELVISDTTEPLVRGVPITATIPGGPRQRSTREPL
jgi:hypothetical protein